MSVKNINNTYKKSWDMYWWIDQRNICLCILENWIEMLILHCYKIYATFILKPRTLIKTYQKQKLLQSSWDHHALKKAMKLWAEKLSPSNVVNRRTVLTLSMIFQDFRIMENSNANHKSFNFLVPERSKTLRL